MIIYGCITEKLDKKEIEDISIKQANQILNYNNITAKSLPGHGNAGLRKKEIKPFVREKPFIKVWYYFKIKNILSKFFTSNADKWKNKATHR